MAFLIEVGFQVVQDFSPFDGASAIVLNNDLVACPQDNIFHMMDFTVFPGFFKKQ